MGRTASANPPPCHLDFVRLPSRASTSSLPPEACPQLLPYRLPILSHDVLLKRYLCLCLCLPPLHPLPPTLAFESSILAFITSSALFPARLTESRASRSSLSATALVCRSCDRLAFSLSSASLKAFSRFCSVGGERGRARHMPRGGERGRARHMPRHMPRHVGEREAGLATCAILRHARPRLAVVAV